VRGNIALIYLTHRILRRMICFVSAHATLRDAILYFADFAHCKAFMVELRWPDGNISCPHGGSQNIGWLESRRVWKCYTGHDKPTFSLKTGTIFEDSPIPLEKWLPAVWMLLNCKNGISSWELHRALGVTQKTAWFMFHRIRLAAQSKTFNKLHRPGSRPLRLMKRLLAASSPSCTKSASGRFGGTGAMLVAE